MVVQIAQARQPDLAFDDLQFAAGDQRNKLSACHGKALCRLLLHHESPWFRIAMIGQMPSTIQ
jgi:hypothetical protein